MRPMPRAQNRDYSNRRKPGGSDGATGPASEPAREPKDAAPSHPPDAPGIQGGTQPPEQPQRVADASPVELLIATLCSGAWGVVPIRHRKRSQAQNVSHGQDTSRRSGSARVSNRKGSPEASDPMTSCERCGQVHTRCKAHNRAGKPCGQYPMQNQRVCKNHGGAKPAAIRNAQRRAVETEVKQVAARLQDLGAEWLKPEDPIQGLMTAVSVCAGMVSYLRSELSKVTEIHGPDHLGDARPHVLSEMLRVWTAELGRASKNALEAGIQERMVRLQEAQADLIVLAFQAAIDHLGLTPAQEKRRMGAIENGLKLVTGRSGA